MESNRPLNEFDIIAFSITFEMDYTNVLAMLDFASLPLRERGKRAPLVVAGGVAVTMNPEPLAPFIDIVFIGEGEGIINPFIDKVVEHGSGDLSVFASVPGAYIPSAYTPVFKQDGTIEKIEAQNGFPEKIKRVWDIDYGLTPNVSRVETPDTVFGDMSLVEIGKGCGKHCRFCAAGYVYRPTRHADIGAIETAIDDALEKKGKVGLVGSAIADHPDVERLFEYIIAKGGVFSVSSLRLDKLTDNMLHWLTLSMERGGSHTITVAPEAGTERLRRITNKDISDETILDTMKRIATAGPFRLKLYFIVGLPGETMEDVKGIVDLVARIREAMAPEWKKRGRDEVITVGVDGFVPKPATPYQWEPFEGVKAVAEKLNLVARGLRSVPRVSVHSGSARQGYIQALLSVGDRRVADMLESAYRLDGDWAKVFRDSDIDPDFFVTRRKERDETLPWSIIDHGLRDDYLAKELKLAGKGKITKECPPPDEACRRCGEFPGVCVPKNS